MGVEYTEKDNLHAAGLEKKTVNWSKGCYLGQEVVCMQEMRGKVKSRLVHLQLVEGSSPEKGEPLLLEEEEVGQVASVAGAHAIARVQTPHYESGVLLRSKNAQLRVL